MRAPEQPEFDCNRAESGKYMVCIGGYPRAIVDSFAEAATQASEMSWRHPDGDFTVYEIETGIHFDLPRGPRLDDGYMALLRLLADDSAQIR